MEKVIAVLMRPEPDDDWCARQRAQVADALLGLGVAGLSINVRDSTVRDSLMTLTTLYPPVAAVVSLWTQQCYGEQVAAALRLLAQECDELGAYLVTESVPLTFPSLVESGSRTPGLANIALLRRPDGLDQATWLTRWQRDHTQVAIEAQATFGYHPELGGTSPHPRGTGNRGHCRRVVSRGGDNRSESLLRSRRRQRSAESDKPDGREHICIRCQPEHRHRANQPLRVQNTVQGLRNVR